jgi:hypothetical protein
MQRRKLTPTRRKLAPPVPDRLPVEQLWAGPKRAFTPKQLSKLENLLEKVHENYWIIVFSGPEYTDVDRAITKSAAEASIRLFRNAYPTIEVTYLQPPAEKPKPNGKAKRSCDKKKYAKAARARQY